MNLSRAGGALATRETNLCKGSYWESQNEGEKNSTNGSREISADSLREVSDGSLKDKIRKRAYELYMERQGGGGSEVEDWLRAEAEVVWRLSH